MSRNMLIRADASTLIGTGHIMRCLALAQAWRQSCGHVTFFAAEITQGLETRLAEEGFETIRISVVPGGAADAASLAAIAQEQVDDESWVVVDGYRFGGDFQRALKADGVRLLFLDDYGHADEYVADVVLNQNLTAEDSLYSRRGLQTRLLLGSHYVLLREEFLHWSDWKRQTHSVARKVLVTLGGADSENVTNKVIQAISDFKDIEVVIVAGGSNPNLTSLVSSISRVESWMRLETDVRNIPDLMAWADVAVAGAGSTAWELAFMGLPTVVLVLAKNQDRVAAKLELEGVCISCGEHEQASMEQIAASLQCLLGDRERREQMTRRGRNLVDGLGARRVVKQLDQLAAAIPLVS